MPRHQHQTRAPRQRHHTTGADAAPQTPPTAGNALLNLQAAVGNQAVGQVLATRNQPAPFGMSRAGAEPRSLSVSVDTHALSDDQLLDELARLEAWLDANPGNDALEDEYARLEAIAARRATRALKAQIRAQAIADVIDAVNAGRVPKWMPVFPFRPSRGIFRLDVAPIMAHRTGDRIVVSQPLIGVKYTDRFRKDVRTLPGEVFLGGLELGEHDLVGVRLYDSGGKVVVVFAEDLLKFADASDNAIWLNIGLTTASVLAGPALGRFLGAGLGRAMTLANRGIVSGMLGLADAAPTALGGFASRTGVALVDGRVGTAIAEQASARAGQSMVQGVAGQEAVNASAAGAATAATPSMAASTGTQLATTAGVAGAQFTSAQLAGTQIGQPDIAGSTTVAVSDAEYAQRLAMVFPHQYDNPVLLAVDVAGQRAADILVNPTGARGPAFVDACYNENWALAGTLFHAEAARQLRLIAPSVPGVIISAEDPVIPGAGGSRLDVTAVDQLGRHYDIDWKTTGRSAFSYGSRAEMRRHAAAYQAVRGAPLDLQVSKSWVDFVRGRIINVKWPR